MNVGHRNKQMNQNLTEDRQEEKAYNPNEEGQHVFKQLSQD